jgi:hypothetical protein
MTSFQTSSILLYYPTVGMPPMVIGARALFGKPSQECYPEGMPPGFGLMLGARIIARSEPKPL